MSEQNTASVAAHFKAFATNSMAWSRTLEGLTAQQLGAAPSLELLFLSRKIAETLTLIYLQNVKDPKHWQSLVSYAYTGLSLALEKEDITPPEEDEQPQQDEEVDNNG